MKSPMKIGKNPPHVLFPNIPAFEELQQQVEETFPQCATEDYRLLSEKHAMLQDSNWSTFVGTSSHVTIEVSYSILLIWMLHVPGLHCKQIITCSLLCYSCQNQLGRKWMVLRM